MKKHCKTTHFRRNFWKHNYSRNSKKVYMKLTVWFPQNVWYMILQNVWIYQWIYFHKENKSLTLCFLVLFKLRDDVIHGLGANRILSSDFNTLQNLFIACKAKINWILISSFVALFQQSPGNKHWLITQSGETPWTMNKYLRKRKSLEMASQFEGLRSVFTWSTGRSFFPLLRSGRGCISTDDTVKWARYTSTLTWSRLYLPFLSKLAEVYMMMRPLRKIN